MIATGLNDDNLQQTPFGKRSTASSFGARRPSSTATTGTATAGTAAGSGMNMPSFSLPTMNATPFGASKTACGAAAQHDADTVKQSPGEGYPDSGFLKKQIGLSVLQ